jgi:hypothetical protein
MLRLLVAILLRQANTNSPTDPTLWLNALQSTKWDAANTQNGQITGTMVNGKSVTISTAGGFSIADLMVATELALQILEQGLTAPMGRTQARLN